MNAFIFFHASHFTSFPLSSPHYLGLEGRGIGCVLDGFPVTAAAYIAQTLNSG
ncbi:nicotinate-nucleotide--dimethylbenzimidazole phosphoribosyltransferase [Treponema endosymbiont of Eucomonympha sp.]|uniref:nicotinate-nucleotide--dimethylbenzimidazole phosphoribosyltransferase n=1 Tax=Treponema endosymbiont of Eucomonympha sp. TaxID=1580831 RepID=UPI001EE6CD3B|nr:nicotinate-nucleotide--dimethylbenzimidazole phosphoribosyltransferase [Treponema endosymbiont of Eucomonympha sp.]